MRQWSPFASARRVVRNRYRAAPRCCHCVAIHDHATHRRLARSRCHALEIVEIRPPERIGGARWCPYTPGRAPGGPTARLPARLVAALGDGAACCELPAALGRRRDTDFYQHRGGAPIPRFTTLPAALDGNFCQPARRRRNVKFCEVSWGTCRGALLRFVTVWESPKSGP